MTCLLAGCTATPSTDGLTTWEAGRLDRLERALAASPERVGDASLLDYLEQLLRRLSPGITPPRLYVIRGSAPQAELLGDRLLRVRTGLLAAVRSEDELAFVLAHELAHRELGHMGARRAADWDGAGAEREADAVALKRLTVLGYDRAAGRALLSRLAADPAAHAALRDRIEALPDEPPATPRASQAFERALAPYRATR